MILRLILGIVLMSATLSAAEKKNASYMGRELANVMGPQGIEWLERDSRESEERISQLVTLLDLKPGMQVADIGAGSGVISRLMAARLLPGGMVHAVDIQQEMLDRLALENKAKGISNIKGVLGGIKSPRLPKGSIDLVLMVDVYHEFSHPLEMLQSIRESLKKGGRIALVEYRGEDPKVPIHASHKMTLEQIKKEYGRRDLNLKFIRVDESLPRQHLVFFSKP